jgi:hypothetical protein
MSSPISPASSEIDAKFEQGRTFHQMGQLDQAEAIYSDVLALDAKHFDAMQLLGVAAFQRGDAARAEELISKAISLFPNDASFYCNLGNAQQAQGDLENALSSYEKAIAMDAGYAGALFSRAQILLRTSRTEEAIAGFDAVISIAPQFFQAHLFRGDALQQLERFAEAVTSYDNALALSPALVEAHVNRGMALAGLNDHAAAIVSYGKAIELQPDRVEIYLNRGAAYAELKQYKEAVADFETVLRLRPDNADAYLNLSKVFRALGQLADYVAVLDTVVAQPSAPAIAYFYRGYALYELERYEEAVVSYDQALLRAPSSPSTFQNRGLSLMRLGRFEDAIENYNRALALNPNLPEPYSDRGLALHDLMRTDEAIESYDQALALRPDAVQPLFNKSLALLMRGDYAEGWKLFGSRRNVAIDKSFKTYPQPEWIGGESLAGKTVLVHSEQGLGDALQFCRYVKLLAQRGARVLLEVRGPLVELLRNLEGAAEIIKKGDPIPDFDFHVPMMSLPHAFGTELSTIPADVPYIRADAAKVAHWREKLGPKTKPRVGLVWNGGLRNDPALRIANARRNVSLEHIAALNMPSVEFYSLQKGEPAESEFRERRADVWPTSNLHDYVPELKDFSDTAALIENLDLVITVDTSTAHLAGGMGKPVWILNRFDTCWRWMRDRTDSPWYPTVRLFRQKKHGDWAPVIADVKEALLSFKP